MHNFVLGPKVITHELQKRWQVLLVVECIPMCLANLHYDLKEQMSYNQYNSHAIRHALKRCIEKWYDLS
jgi:hypothetical protein